MKVILLSILLVAAMCEQAWSKIRNGYAPNHEYYTTSLRALQGMLSGSVSITADERHALKIKIRLLQDFTAYYRLTEEALLQMQMISPNIYNEMDNIKDLQGRETDIYVRLIPKENSAYPLNGASIFQQSTTDPDAHTSIYGDRSVAVDVLISETSLILLSHEMGHVKYIVPNLASYMEFYKRIYSGETNNWSYIGHCPCDQSGKLANAYVRGFKRDLHEYIQSTGKRPTRIWSMLFTIRREMNDPQPSREEPAIAASYKK